MSHYEPQLLWSQQRLWHCRVLRTRTIDTAGDNRFKFVDATQKSARSEVSSPITTLPFRRSVVETLIVHMRRLKTRILNIFGYNVTGSGRRSGRQKLGLLAIMKNEAMNIREWVDHYRWQGVEKIYLIDNGSTDNGTKLIEQELISRFIELFVLPEQHRQVEHYQTVFQLGKIREQVEWLMVADLDEFWFSPNSNLRDAVSAVEAADLIYANWKMFGSCGYQSHPSSLRLCLTLRAPNLASENNTKWICRTDAIVDPRNIEIHKVRGVAPHRTLVDNDRFHLNHYPLQSVEYFTKVKMTRGDVRSKDLDSVRTLEYFDLYNLPATHLDRLLAEMAFSEGETTNRRLHKRLTEILRIFVGRTPAE